MVWHKLRAGGHILACLAGANIRAVIRAYGQGLRAGTRELARAVLRGSRAAMALLRLRGKYRARRLVELSLESGTSLEAYAHNSEALFSIAEIMNEEQKYEQVIDLLTPLVQPIPRHAKCYGVRGLAYLGLGRYQEALADLNTCHRLSPRLSRDFNYDLYRAYLHGLRGEAEAARSAMAAQSLRPGAAGSTDQALAEFLFRRLHPHLKHLHLRGSIGVVIGSFHNAVGHAILDPFHFLQLYRHRFDHLILAHPPYEQYTLATRLAAGILDSYVEQIEIEDPQVLNFAWQNIGELRHANVTFLVHNYWSLNRMAYQARMNPHHPMAQGRNYLTLPPRIVDRAEAICRRNHLELTRPLVVVHTREHGYHGLRGQSYRNTDVRNYIPALRRLVSLGYQVVRIGDAKMYSVRGEVPGLLELPATDYYDTALDPYLISRCRFMISCQSGPCSYARVFGKPNLVINAVYHYTLLPENNELIAFKQYREAKTGRALSVEDVFRAGGHLFDRTEHFVRAGIEVEDMTSEEILAATEEMLAWLDDPARPETAYQQSFREMMCRFAANPDPTNTMTHGLTDYIGYALPECRISDAVCRLRPGYLPTPETPAEPRLRAA